MADGKRKWTTTRAASNARADAGRKARKKDRIEAQRLREIENRATRAAGGLTPWERACALRAERRKKLQKRAS